EELDDIVTGNRHRGVMKGWDNSARRRDTPVILTGATPTSLRRWLRRIVLSERRRGGERVVFVNAWNEWAEGTYLEPDRDFGHGWLEAVASAVDAEWPAMQVAGPGAKAAGAKERWVASANRAMETTL